MVVTIRAAPPSEIMVRSGRRNGATICWRGEIVVDAQRIGEDRQRILARPFPLGDRDPTQLLLGRAEAVLVTTERHRGRARHMHQTGRGRPLGGRAADRGSETGAAGPLVRSIGDHDGGGEPGIDRHVREVERETRGAVVKARAERGTNAEQGADLLVQARRCMQIRAGDQAVYVRLADARIRQRQPDRIDGDLVGRQPRQLALRRGTHPRRSQRTPDQPGPSALPRYVTVAAAAARRRRRSATEFAEYRGAPEAGPALAGHANRTT